eukprot:sb/3475751/
MAWRTTRSVATTSLNLFLSLANWDNEGVNNQSELVIRVTWLINSQSGGYNGRGGKIPTIPAGMKQPIRTRYLGHVTGNQPIRNQYFRMNPLTQIYTARPRFSDPRFSVTKSAVYIFIYLQICN